MISLRWLFVFMINWQRFADPEVKKQVREANMDRDMVTTGMNVITVLLALTLGVLFVAIIAIGIIVYGR